MKPFNLVGTRFLKIQVHGVFLVQQEDATDRKVVLEQNFVGTCC